MNEDTDTVQIRDAKESDAETIVAFLAALHAEKLDTVTSRPPPSVEDERQFLAKALSSERVLILVATSGDEVIGFLDVWGGQQTHNRHAGHFGMSVAQAWRRRGLGRRLLDTAIDRIKTWPGFCRLEGEVAHWNAASLALCGRSGLTLEARKRKAINLRGKPEDLLLLALVWAPTAAGYRDQDISA